MPFEFLDTFFATKDFAPSLQFERLNKAQCRVVEFRKMQVFLFSLLNRASSIRNTLTVLLVMQTVAVVGNRKSGRYATFQNLALQNEGRTERWALPKPCLVSESEKVLDGQ